MALNKDKEIQQRLFYQYHKDIAERNERYVNSRLNQINEEKERNDAISKELDAEKSEMKNRKKQLAYLQYSDLMQRQEDNRLKRLMQNKERQIPVPVSLDLNSEQRLNSFKEYMVQLSEINDKKLMQYNNFTLSPFPRMSSKKSKEIEETLQTIPNVNKRESTSVTDGSVFDKYNNKDYADYKDKQKEYLNYNLYLSKSKEYSKERLYDQRREIGGQMAVERNIYSDYEREARNQQNERKQLYKNTLDEQRQYQIPSKLANEKYTVSSAVCNPQFNHFYDQSPPNQTFLNHNKYVEVNPCKQTLISNYSI